MSGLTLVLDRLTLGMNLIEGQIEQHKLNISALEREMAGYKAYDRVLDQENGRRHPDLIATHGRWLSGEKRRVSAQLRQARQEVKAAQRRLEPFKAEQARREAQALEKLQTKLSPKPGPVGTIGIMIGPERTSGRKHKKARRYVAKGERRQRQDEDGDQRRGKSGKKKDKTGKRSKQRQS